MISLSAYLFDFETCTFFANSGAKCTQNPFPVYIFRVFRQEMYTRNAGYKKRGNAPQKRPGKSPGLNNSFISLSSFVIVRMDRLDSAVFRDVELCELNRSLV